MTIKDLHSQSDIKKTFFQPYFGKLINTPARFC